MAGNNMDVASIQYSMGRNKRSRAYQQDGRMSVRSKGSSAGSSSEDRTKVIKNCCRFLIEFIFTQVGVGGLVVCYTIVGAFAFQAIETMETDDLIEDVSNRRHEAVMKLWNITSNFNTLNQRLWNETTQDVIKKYQVKERWTFPAALMFTLSVITMIGYGNTVPKSDWGKIATMVYALIGIPVYILYFMNMGKVFANAFKWIYRKIHYCTLRRKAHKYDMMDNYDMEEIDIEEHEVMLPSTACVWVMLAYLGLGTVMFAEWEGWNYLDSVYFCVTSLLKIGIGDFVPGQSDRGNLEEEENHAKLYINFSYILLGMGVVAMNYYLLKEEVLLRAAQMKKKLRET